MSATIPTTPPAPPQWMAQAVCAHTDPDAFYPDKGQPNGLAKRVCAGCPVASACLDYALARDERHGVWGGLSPRERDQIRRDRDLPTRTQRHRADNRATAHRMLGAGHPKTDIARALRVSLTTLHTYLTDPAPNPPTRDASRTGAAA